MTEHPLPDLYDQWESWKPARQALITLTAAQTRGDRRNCRNTTKVPNELIFTSGFWQGKTFRRRMQENMLRGYEFLLRGTQHADYSVVMATGLWHTMILLGRLRSHKLFADPTAQRTVNLLALARGEPNLAVAWDGQWYPVPWDSFEQSRDAKAAYRVLIASNWWRVVRALRSGQDIEHVVHCFEDHLLPVAQYQYGLSDVLEAFGPIRTYPGWYEHDRERCTASWRDKLCVPEWPSGPPPAV